MTDKKKLVRIINVADGSTRLLQWAQIAQLVEQRTENPRVTGSIPVLGINPYKYYLAVFVRVFYVQLLPVTGHIVLLLGNKGYVKWNEYVDLCFL